MKLQIKTMNQKSLLIDIEEDKTVFDLKKELSMYPDVGVQPEFQKLIYAGKILPNDDQLSTYNIDVKKFLVVMILKQPQVEEPPAAVATTSKTVATAAEPKPSSSSVEDFKAPLPPTSSTVTPMTQSPSAEKSEQDSLVESIVSMGYTESKVRRALQASFNNPERAIEYLIEGIPTSPSAPESATDNTDADETMSPFEMFRTDPIFQNLRRALHQHPDLINDAIKTVGEANPSLLSLINENQQEFLSMLIADSDDDEDDDDDDDDE